MAHLGTMTTETTGANRADRGDLEEVSLPGPVARPVALLLGVAGCAALGVWFAWRISNPITHPVAVVFLFCELTGWAAWLAIAVALGTAGERRHVFGDRPADSHWFALAVADLVGRTRVADLHREVRTVARAAPFWRWRDPADAAVAAVLVEGPRRLLVVLAVSLGLLLGQSPIPVPPWWAIAAAVAGHTALSTCLVVLGRNRLRVGDRMRWSYGAIGEVVVRTDVVGHAPRRLLGAMAVAVGMSVAVALRGISDRWTHGLAPMDYGDRAVSLVIAVSIVAGALSTVRTTTHPATSDPHLVVRRLDERGMRQYVLTAAVFVGVIGLTAGLAPGREPSAPPADRAPFGAVEELRVG